MLAILGLVILFICYGFHSLFQRKVSSKIVRIFFVGGAVLNILVAVYYNYVYKTAAFNTMDYIRNEAPKINSVYQFTNCHNNPHYAFVHRYQPVF